ncbi:MAG: hypothetical protein ABSF48_23375 [Thermodesulfobacteriota bacterium]|jgi:hypothetical protein
MSIVVTTDKPNGLLSAIRSAIDTGEVKTWEYDKDGDFTHSAEQWKLKAWLRPKLEDERIIFHILPPQGIALSRTVYAVYHGRFIEMLLTHFDTLFDRAVTTALATHGDIVKP